MNRGAHTTRWSLQESTDRAGTIRHVDRKTLQRQCASLQSDSSMERNSGDDTMTKSTGAESINNIMKPSASMGDFQTRGETPRVLKTSATLPEAVTDTSEVSERSSLARSRTMANELNISQPLNALADGALVITPKGSEYKSPKTTDKDGSVDLLNALNAATKHRKERFQKWFPDIAATDEMLQYYYCAYSREILFPGFLYVTNGWLCFHSKIMGKKNDEDSLNGSSQNGDRNDGNNGTSGSTDEGNAPSASDDSPYYDSHLATGSRSDLASVEPADVTLKRHTAQSSRDPITSHDVAHGGKKSESSGMGDNRRGWRSNLSEPLNTSKLTTVVLFLTTILIIFLIASACLLAFKLIHLQAQMEASLLLPVSSALFSDDSAEPKDQVNEDIYHLKQEQHLSSIQRLHSLLEVHLKLLDKVNQSLKGLRQGSLNSCSGLAAADEYVPDSNS